MTYQAPPSQAYKIVELHDPYSELVRRRGVKGIFVGCDEAENPWVPWGDNADVRYLGFDVRLNITYVHLRIRSAGVIGTHYHRGRVILMPITGTMRYLEYDWVAGPGGFVLERPGEAHTLVTDDPNGATMFGMLEGAIDLYDDQGTLIVTADVWYWMNHYETFCRQLGLAPNEALYV